MNSGKSDSAPWLCNNLFHMFSENTWRVVILDMRGVYRLETTDYKWAEK